MLDYQSQQWSLGILAANKSSALLKGLSQNAGSFLRGGEFGGGGSALFSVAGSGFLNLTRGLEPASSKPPISRTCRNFKVVAAENMTIKRCLGHLMANLSSVCGLVVSAVAEETIFQVKTVISLYNLYKIETGTKGDCCFVAIPKFCFCSKQETKSTMSPLIRNALLSCHAQTPPPLSLLHSHLDLEVHIYAHEPENWQRILNGSLFKHTKDIFSLTEIRRLI